MDITVIKAQETNSTTGIKIGSSAPKTMVEFLNLACPYCKQWFQESLELVNGAVNSGQLQRVIKLYDKEKESLQKGNIMHRFVTTSDSNQALEDITKIFQTQSQWQNLPFDEVAIFAQSNLGLTEHNHVVYADEIVAEANRANIKFVPTIILDEHIFDENISEEQLKDLLQN